MILVGELPANSHLVLVKSRLSALCMLANQVFTPVSVRQKTSGAAQLLSPELLTANASTASH